MFKSTIKWLFTGRLPAYIRYPGAAICFSMAGYTLWTGDIFKKRNEPVYYADGSVEYTLVDRPVSRDLPVNRHREGGSWVLRFPNLIECRQEKSGGTCDNFAHKRHLPIFKSTPYGESLRWKIKSDDFSFFDKAEESDRLEYIDVNPHTFFFPLFERKSELEIKRLKSLRLDKRRSKERGFGKIGGWDACKHAKEISPNFYQLRQATEEEIAAGSDAPSLIGINECYPSREGYNGYRLVNSDGRRIAHGNCYAKVRTEARSYALCLFDIWVPQERRVGLSFDRQHLEKFPEIYKYLVQFFNDVTVVDKSENLNWRPQTND